MKQKIKKFLWNSLVELAQLNVIIFLVTALVVSALERFTIDDYLPIVGVVNIITIFGFAVVAFVIDPIATLIGRLKIK